ncbi:MAG TPA: TetR/AcrR family transcriptional regulator C-terminal domain-containing protein [Nevskiaceae bacterium]|nr:TetR/AcrR family transcriptional regulator C-terminal domain-containing protein [Nevskiaceae bacterium]
MARLRLRPEEPATRRGRPARVSAADIVDVAIRIGLSRVTLAAVARELRVSVPALYRHVRNRDEIVKLAAIELAVRRAPPDGEGGRHWADVVRGCAHGMVALFVAEPQLICEVMNGTLGPDGEMDFVEQFLAVLTPHGFEPAEAVRIHHAVAMLAIGAAVSATAMKSGYAGGVSHERAVREALRRRASGELPLLRRALPAYLRVDPEQWREALDALVAGIAAHRGEPRSDSRKTASRRTFKTTKGGDR